jgi:hypothetical protein
LLECSACVRVSNRAPPTARGPLTTNVQRLADPRGVRPAQPPRPRQNPRMPRLRSIVAGVRAVAAVGLPSANAPFVHRTEDDRPEDQQADALQAARNCAPRARSARAGGPRELVRAQHDAVAGGRCGGSRVRRAAPGSLFARRSHAAPAHTSRPSSRTQEAPPQ